MSLLPGPHIATSTWRPILDGAAATLHLPSWRGYAPGVWLEAIAFHESSGNPQAFHQDKPGWLTCSYGLFQIEGATAQRYGINDPTALYHPILNLALALRRLEELITEYGQDSDAHIDQVLAGYNGGEGWGAQYKTVMGAPMPPGSLILNDQAYVDAIRGAAILVAADRAGDIPH
jgi:hypothetical protein